VALDCTVRQLQPDDALIKDYRDLRLELWPDCKEDCNREIAAMLANPERWAVFVASLEDGKAAGFLEVSLRDYAEGANSSPVPYLEGWFVADEYRRRGLGKALIKAAEEWAILRGCSEIASDTWLENAVSIAAHERLGYKEVERQVCFLKQLKT
jgi:aminoglycoside 6'-N-acetyltransferase I